MTVAPFELSPHSGVIPVDPAGYVVVEDSGTRHKGFPTMAVLPDGRLILAYTSASYDGAPDGDVAVRYSSDWGLTWSAEEIILSHLTAGVGVGAAGVHVDSSGVIRIAYQHGSTPLQTRILTSRDNGATWPEIATITTSLTGLCACSEPIVELPGGVLILPLYGYASGGGPEFTSTLVKSTDDGVTWGSEVTIAAAAGGLSWGEPNVVRRADGVLVCMIRECTYTVATYISTSSDNGATWSTPAVAFSSAGGAPRISQLASGALICGGRGTTSPVGRNVYRNSWDGGATWEAETVLESTGVFSDYSYPCEIMDGLVAFVYGRRTSFTTGSIRLVYLFDGFNGETPLGTRNDLPWPLSPLPDLPTLGRQAIEAWVTDPSGTYLDHLDRSEASPFRHFAVSRVLRDVGLGSLEVGLPNATLERTPNLLDDGNLVWMRYRGKTTTWVIEERGEVLDSSEGSSLWTKVQGRTVRQLLGDRLVWPTAFGDPPSDPSTWSSQWRSFVDRAAGEMLWDLISESNGRFSTQLARGTVETTGADGWTQDLRFDNLLDVVDAVEAAYGGDVDLEGLTFSYYAALGTDRSSSVIFEEGADLVSASRDRSDRDTATWVVGEGVGEGVFAKLAVAKDLTAARRREAYLDAKDAGNVPLLQLFTDAALSENGPRDQVGFEATEDRFLVFVHYGLGDTIRAIVPTRGIDASKRVVGIYLAEGDDDRVHVELDLEALSRDREGIVQLTEEQKTTARSLGRVTRQPQGQLVPFAFSGAGVFDENDTLETHFWIPSRMYVEIEAKVALDFRPYFAPATAASSGGGSTSGPSSSSTSDDENAHYHGFGLRGGTVTGTTRGYVGKQGGAGADFNLPTDANAPVYTNVNTNHHHGMAHTHTTPNHSHGLTFGVYKEGFPASHSVTLKVYELVAGTWTLRGTIAGLTADAEEVDLTAYVDGPGKWRLDLVSAAGQPNGGRLAAYVSGYVLGAIQSS